MTQKQFRIFLTLSWLFGLSTIIVSLLTLGTLPFELRDYLRSRANIMNTTREISYFYSGFPLISGIFVSVIGLYLWKNWARILFVTMIIFGSIVQFLSNSPVIMPLFAEPLSAASGIFSGIVVCAMYFCEGINDKFTNNFKAQQQNSGETKSRGSL